MPGMTRRGFLAAAGAASAGLFLAGCGGQAAPVAVGPTHPAVRAAEDRRRRAGAAVRDVTIAAAPLALDVGGLGVDTWGYNAAVPASEVRLKAGEVLRARFVNDLPEATTIHWHGISLRNDMDGVPGITQDAVAPGSTFTYEFTAPDPGTFWFHPHVGLHLDTGLYAPLIVEDPADPGRYDREYVVVLDDWTHGLGQSPEQAFDDLRHGRGAHAAHLAAAAAGGDPGPMSEFLASSGGDVLYPLYLINGRRPSGAVTFDARPSEVLRLRILNAASDTPFRVALGGHQLTVTHTDGFPVEHVTVDSLVVAMAERYDVLVRVNGSGVFPLVAVAEAKAAQALAFVRSGPGDAPPPDVRPAELDRRVLRLEDLHAADAVQLPARPPDRLVVADLGGGEEGYVWTINGDPHGADEPIPVRQGERVRLVFRNTTTMFHPMHLHGHTYQVVLPTGPPGARKDTTIVRPGERVTVDFDADNPGLWMLHCHNVYHQRGGMMTTLAYVEDRGATPGAERTAPLRLVCDWLGVSAT